MRTRDTYLKDYGITPEEAEQIRAACKSHRADVKKAILDACIIANPEIADQLFYSLARGIGYDSLCRSQHVPIKRVDFYAYQRKALAAVKALLAKEKGG